MVLKTFSSQEEKLQTCEAACFSVKLPDGTVMKMSVYTVPLICESRTGQTVALARKMYPGCMYEQWYTSRQLLYRSKASRSWYTYWLRLITAEVRGGESGPTALHTRLCRVLSGPTECSTYDCDSSSNLVSRTYVLWCATEPSQPQNSDLSGELRKLWDLVSLGISSSEVSVHQQHLLSASKVWSTPSMEG